MWKVIHHLSLFWDFLLIFDFSHPLTELRRRVREKTVLATHPSSVYRRLSFTRCGPTRIR